jgi:membrane protease YdiL (CAAX protease family)
METPEPRRRPTAGAALFLFTAVLFTNVGLDLVLSRAGLSAEWMLAMTPLLVLGWTGAAAWFFRVELKETFLLRLPSGSDVLMAIPLAISFVVLNDQLSSLTDSMIPDEVREALLGMLRIDGVADGVFKVSTIALGAAVSEELMFRGFIQSAFGSSMSRTAAVIWTSFFFMALHVLPLPSFAAAGLVLGFVAVATRSILVPILIHFLNNAAALALVNWTNLETLGDPVWIPAPILVPATLIFLLTSGFFARRILTEPAPLEPPRSSEADGADESAGPPRAAFRAPPLSEELAEIPAAKRRRGWLVVALAVSLGVAVLIGLSVYSIYLARPQAVHQAFIEALSQTCRDRLSPEAFDRTDELEDAFEALAAVNDRGSLTFRSLLEVFSVSASVSSDGTIDLEELDVLIDRIRETVRAAAAPRRL